MGAGDNGFGSSSTVSKPVGEAIAPGPPGASPHPLRRWLRWIAAAGWAVVLLVFAHRLAPQLALDPLVSFGIGLTAVAATVLATASRCPPAGRLALPGAALPMLALVWLSAHPLPDLEMAVAVTACLLLGCTLLGSIVGSAIEHAGHLVFVAIVSAAADVFSVFHPSGPSAAIVQSETALSVLALPWPMLGTAAIEPLLGAGDVVFTALYVASARRHGLAMGRTLLALTAAFAMTMVCVIVLEVAVPALPFLGLAMVAAHPEARRPPLRDRNRGYAMAAAVVAVVAGLLLL